MNCTYIRAWVAAVIATFALTLTPHSAADEHDSSPRAAADTLNAYPHEPAVTYHRFTLGGETLYFRATAGITTLGDRNDEPAANMFSIAYERIAIDFDQLMGFGGVSNNPEAWPQARTGAFVAFLNELSIKETGGPITQNIDPWVAFLGLAEIHARGWADDSTPMTETFVESFGGKDRPVTFSFNGGPGSSSIWLHLGIFGPWRTAYEDSAGNPGPPPYRPVLNEASLLNASDFVFIDPVSTGYSRAVKGTDASAFHSVDGDIDSVSDFIRRWITSNNRWGSPLFVAGESYGTTRAAGLVDALFTDHGIATNGVILISSVIDFATIRFNLGNDLPPILFLPTYAATAHYHGALTQEHQDKDVLEFVREVEAFALSTYGPALLLGDMLPVEERSEIARQLADYTGVSAEWVMNNNLRINIFRYTKELLRDRRLTVGRLDSRFTGTDRDAGGESFEYDPSYSAIVANYSATLLTLMREELNYDADIPYKVLTGDVRPWDYSQVAQNQYLYIAERLRSALNKVPGMRVFVASGLYDLATPHFATDYTLSHMALPQRLKDNITVEYYEAGHMMYLHDASRAALKDHLDAFYAATLHDHLSKDSQ